MLAIPNMGSPIHKREKTSPAADEREDIAAGRAIFLDRPYEAELPQTALGLSLRLLEPSFMELAMVLQRLGISYCLHDA